MPDNKQDHPNIQKVQALLTLYKMLSKTSKILTAQPIPTNEDIKQLDAKQKIRMGRAALARKKQLKRISDVKKILPDQIQQLLENIPEEKKTDLSYYLIVLGCHHMLPKDAVARYVTASTRVALNAKISALEQPTQTGEALIRAEKLLDASGLEPSQEDFQHIQRAICVGWQTVLKQNTPYHSHALRQCLLQAIKEWDNVNHTNELLRIWFNACKSNKQQGASSFRQLLLELNALRYDTEPVRDQACNHFTQWASSDADSLSNVVLLYIDAEKPGPAIKCYQQYINNNTMSEAVVAMAIKLSNQVRQRKGISKIITEHVAQEILTYLVDMSTLAHEQQSRSVSSNVTPTTRLRYLPAAADYCQNHCFLWLTIAKQIDDSKALKLIFDHVNKHLADFLISKKHRSYRWRLWALIQSLRVKIRRINVRLNANARKLQRALFQCLEKLENTVVEQLAEEKLTSNEQINTVLEYLLYHHACGRENLVNINKQKLEDTLLKYLQNANDAKVWIRVALEIATIAARYEIAPYQQNVRLIIQRALITLHENRKNDSESGLFQAALTLMNQGSEETVLCTFIDNLHEHWPNECIYLETLHQKFLKNMTTLIYEEYAGRMGTVKRKVHLAIIKEINENVALIAKFASVYRCGLAYDTRKLVKLFFNICQSKEATLRLLTLPFEIVCKALETAQNKNAGDVIHWQTVLTYARAVFSSRKFNLQKVIECESYLKKILASTSQAGSITSSPSCFGYARSRKRKLGQKPNYEDGELSASDSDKTDVEPRPPISKKNTGARLA